MDTCGFGEIRLKPIEDFISREEAKWKLLAGDDRPLVLESVKYQIMVTRRNSRLNHVAEVPQHGHKWQFLVVQQLLPYFCLIAALRHLRLPRFRYRQTHSLPRSFLLPNPKQTASSKV